MKKKQKAVSGTTEDSLEQQALSQLNAMHYKEAIALYKELLAVSDDDKWQKQIAYCYLQRALTFAARGMLKEALVLWENHCQYTQPPYQAYDYYIIWLIEAKNQTKIHTCLAQLSAQQLDKQYPGLASVLGLLIMTAHSEFQQYLPQDSVFIAHFKLVQTALQAYQDSNQEKLTETLKKLPYRSAFRDFRTLLNAVIVMPAEIEKTRSLLAKISENSPYNQMARLLQSSTLEGSALAEALLKFSSKQRRIIGQIKGLNIKQLELVDQLFRRKDRLSDKVKFNLAIQYKALCGAEVAKQFCQELLVTYPVGIKDFKKKFSSINKFEENRLNALIYERDRNGYEAEFFWKKCVKILIDEDADNNLKIALILRHIVNLQEYDDERTELLIESLDYDPDDRDSYMQILDYYGKQQEAGKDYRLWLKKTVDKFPQDIDVLTLAINTATEKKAYKKASQYALKLLKIDPLNSFAKQVLFSSHLARTRQLIKDKKYQLVENEIQQAEKLNLDKVHITQIQLMRGLFCFFDQDKQQGLQLIVESLNKLNSDPLNASFQAIMEAQLTGLPVATLLRELPSAKEHILSAQELTRFIRRLKEYVNEDANQQLLHKSLAKIKSSLKESLLQPTVDENQLLTLCQLLDKINHFELLCHCAKIALDSWENPIWKYYQVYAETKGVPEQCQQIKIMHLEITREQAMADKYHRVVVLIDSFIDRYYQVHPERNMGFLDDFLGADIEQEIDESEDPLESLFGHISENILLKLNKKVESLLRKTSPEMLAEKLRKKMGNDENIMLAMMQQPDLFSALLMLGAAEELGIDIGVSIGDVLEKFGVDKQADMFSFPF
jgi:hypothetical protein